MSEYTEYKPERIAIIGSSCRFPGGCNSPAKLWGLLKQPVDIVTEIPESRFNAKGFYHDDPEHAGTTNVTKAYLLEEDPCAFDNEFFGISAKEAESMDPQQRIILEVIYECIESAGYTMSQLRGSSTAVFVGQMSDDYREMILRDVECHPQYTATGSARSILANRVSYIFDWKGPSLNIDTACSSSLAALHLAVQSLRSGESDMAVVAGVNLIYNPEVFSFLSSLHMISPSAQCRMWDASADGYGRGEGFAAVIIKTVRRALADGDDIESVIRNTAMNQDGRSAGLTVPSAAAQTNLTKLAYERCGLDCEKEEDRCQYFEAHGTGTPTGDPKEAEGISKAFFPSNGLGYAEHRGPKELRSQKIHVGSIKTVIGHLEGTAGLASLIKASQAVKHGLIPPNLHFNQLNPDIEPYYHHLEVSTSLKPWPELQPGAPRRADVNSFGFGGTNVHAIVESWDNEPMTATSTSLQTPIWGPFVLSAHSEKTLAATVVALSAFLKTEDNTSLHELAWTLQNHRTSFKYRASFSAPSKDELIDKLDLAINDKEQSPLASQAVKVPKIRILGVFTGQGAQWPSMGKSLFLHSASFRHTIMQLESILKDIADPPSWSLTEELLRPADPDRILSAVISQPLCTALQVALINLLEECGISFNAVVGHSSGEIAAAYAAGVLSARDAILIAYYRGYHCRQIQNNGGISGKMMAVGMTPQDAQKICSQSSFLGRIIVAAENSDSSATLSGDSDAIDEAKAMLDERAVFARILKVDNAYHSHHMKVVREPYLTSLENANIKPLRNCLAGTCNWYSSVQRLHNNRDMTTPLALENEYWVDNMVNPVLFLQAITSATQKEDFDLALEIGPHPALKGSVTETIKIVSGCEIPYQGVLERNRDALECFSYLLGFVWKSFDPEIQHINFEGFQKACNGSQWTKPKIYKGLPPYPWDHDKSMLKESRRSKDWRMRNTVFHELLGRPLTGRCSREVRWRNILKFEDMEWLQGHQFQNQILVPASGYLVMAVDATAHMLGSNCSIQLIELEEIMIHNGIALKEGYPGIDMTFDIRLVHEDTAGKMAEFSCICRNVDAASTDFVKEVFSGRVVVTLGPPVDDVLPRSVASSLPMTDVSIDRFYFWMEKVGLRYSDSFVLESIRRRLDYATVTTKRNPAGQYTIHPATLDSINQGLYAAFCYPGDGRMWTTYLPKSFRQVRFVMPGCRHKDNCASSQLVANCYLSESSSRSICGDIDIFCPENGRTEIQIQGAVFSSLDIPSTANDRTMFWKTTWKKEISSITELGSTETTGVEDFELHELCERSAFFYLKNLCEEVEKEDITSMEWHLQSLVRWAQDSVLPTSQSGQHTHWKTSWIDDTAESLRGVEKDQNVDQVDLKLIHHLGSRLPSILRGTETALQVLKEDDMLDTLYTEALGFRQSNTHLGVILDHFAHQSPRMRVLEIGAGTGGSTATALRHLDFKVENYTFTDISSAFFQAAQTRFAEYEDIMKFQLLDIERSSAEQGFQPYSYDLVIAAHVLHVTKSIAQTVRNCRQLLRPGGHMILLEITNPMTLRIPFLFSALPGWWLGHEEGRTGGPTVTEAQWNTVLTDNHFSGVDCSFRDFEDDRMQTFSVMVTQAMDERISLLRNPLNLGSGVARIENLFIIGGHTLVLSMMATRIQTLLNPLVEHLIIINDFEDIPRSGFKYGSAVICLSGLEEATFSRMDENHLSAMQSLFRNAKYIILTTRGCRSDDPYASMMVGVARAVSREAEHLRLKLVDVDRIDPWNSQLVAVMFSEMLLRMTCLDQPDYDDVVWSNETEVAIEEGAVVIPRIVPNNELNDSFNSARHKITKNMCPTSNSIQVHTGNDGVYVTAEVDNRMKQLHSDPLQVLSSSLFQFVCSDDGQPFYLSLAQGTDGANQIFLTISETNSSMIKTSSSLPVAYNGDAGADEFLLWILTVIICESLLLSTTGTSWFHNADDGIGEIIYYLANCDNIPVFLTTSRTVSQLVSAGKSGFIHPRATERECISLLPRNLGRFVNMGPETDSVVEFANSFLGHEKVIYQGVHNVNVKQTIALSQSKSRHLENLKNYSSMNELLQLLGRIESTSVIKVDQLKKLSKTANATSVISWIDVQSVPVPVKPAVDCIRFAADKTYFLVGLTGDVGLSLCHWMADHGCKYLAIASRNPHVSPEICQRLQRHGVTLRIFALNVADMKSLNNVHTEIVSSMPPIAGVANGALVVRDRPSDSMSLEDLTAVFEPKVVGSQNLDELFFSSPLDFFILFSSVSSIVGHTGQANYHAANLFMSTLAIKRRKRGLAASVMHFGMLLGFGFLHGQAESSLEARFQREDLHAIPEPDFHAIFAQAIISGRSDCGLDPEIIVGLGTGIDTPWRSIPRFSHCRVKNNDERRKKCSSHHEDHPMRSIEVRLKVACNEEQALSILKEAIAGRVGLALGSPNGEIDAQMGLIRLGLDSLIAVEIRSWLLRVLQIDVPVLRFLSGSSLDDICHDVLNDLPSSLKPWLIDMENDLCKPNQTVGRFVSDQDARDHWNEYILNDTEERKTEGTDTILVVDSNGEPDVRLDLLSQAILPDKKDEQLLQTSFERIGDMPHAQAELYFLHEYLQNNAYNVAYYGRFMGQLDLKRLEKALWLVGMKHEALRSAYFLDKATAKPVQAVISEPRIIVAHRIVSDDNDVKSEIDAVKDFKFEIEKGVVMKVSILKHSANLHTILISHHHIALDGVAWTVFVADLAKAYSGRLSSSLTDIPQSIDMSQRKAKALTPEILQDDLIFWEDIYRTIPEPLPLFSFAKYRARPAIADHNNDINNFKLPGDMHKLVEMAAAKIGVTSFHFYLSSFVTFLSRCLGVHDVAIGVVDANRTNAEDMGTVGYFLNMLPVRIIVDQSEQFDAVARRSFNATLAALTHSQASLNSIIGRLGITRSTSHHPLFQVAINYRKSPNDETEFGTDGKIQWDGGVQGGNPYDLLLNIVTTPNSSIISMITQRNIYRASDGALILKWYTRALEALARDPRCRISRCPISNESDIKEAIELGLGDDVEVPWKGKITDRIDIVAATLPEAIAIRDENGLSLTYAQMTERMIEITRQLSPLPPRSYVAMLLDPVADAINCILAILRLDLVWIPLDTRGHPRRVQAVVEDSQPRVLVCHDATQEMAKQITTSMDCVYLLNIDSIHVSRVEADNNIPVPMERFEDVDNGKSQPAMILYTSGSTGVPKGVMLTHEGLVNQIYGTTITFNLGREITLQQSPLGFDLMLDQIFLALANGGTTIIVGKYGRGDPTHIANLIIRHGVTLTHFVPSEYSGLLNYGQHILTEAHSWRYAMSGGEKLTSEVRRAFRKLNLDDVKLINVYGPAEISLACARGTVPYQDGDDTRDHLRPSPNYGFEIMDDDMNVIPVGFPGEICILGRGVGLGYLQRPEESAARFIQRNTDKPSASHMRLYRSGDKGRILPDGTLEVLGRLDGDSQVKINGFRVELDEIANAIVNISNGALVKAAASLKIGQPLDVLVAFVVFDVAFTDDKFEFIEAIRSKIPLPPIMRPSFIVPVQKIPVTANGKTDRDAVNKLPIAESQCSSSAESLTHSWTPLKQTLKDIWEEVLSSRTPHIFGSNHHQIVVQPNSDFFQIGDSSILMIKLKALIELHFGVTLSMPELFHASALHEMATLVEGISKLTQDIASTQTTVSFLAPNGAHCTIDWDLEIASLVDGLHRPYSVPTFSKASACNSGLIVVLSGATGFIGTHLVSKLVQDPRVALIHCLAIRPDTDGKPRHVSVKSDKIVEHTGDLSTLNLGLSHSEFTFLTNNAHCIIHNGADVSLLKTYQSLRRANVLSTRTLCQMAIPRGIPLHYVSTASVAKAIKHGEEEPLYEVPVSSAVPELLNSIDGYAASKWVSERILDKAAAHKELPAYVHRLAHVVGNDASELDAVGMLTKYSIMLRALPRIEKEYIKGQWDFIMVQEVAKDLVDSAMESTTTNTSGITFFNHCSKLKVPHDGLEAYLEKLSGFTLQEIDMKDWLTLAREKGLHPLVYEFLAAFNEGRRQMVLPMIAKGLGPSKSVASKVNSQ